MLLTRQVFTLHFELVGICDVIKSYCIISVSTTDANNASGRVKSHFISFLSMYLPELNADGVSISSYESFSFHY